MPSRITVTGRIPQEGLDMIAPAWIWDHDTPAPIDELHCGIAGSDAVLTLITTRVDDAFLEAAGPQLRVVSNVAVGYNNIDVEACTSRGIQVTNTPGVLTDATADLAMALILMATRRLGEGERIIRSGEPWQWGMFYLLGAGLRGRTLGIVGMGAIGSALAERASAFGMSAIYSNRTPAAPEVEKRTGAQFVSLDQLLATADIVSLHCPYSPETHHLIDATALAAMKPTAFLINTARGPVVDEAALVAALQSGQIAGAGLDVFENEPTVHPGLLDCENAVLVPHLGSATVETRGAMAALAARNALSVLAGTGPLNPVNHLGS